jgi:flagellar basal-body rod modification protein FlgD
MQVDSIAGASAAPQAAGAGSAASGAGQLDYDAFLKLLIAQMQNQDPMEPMKSSDYVAQLATFSQVEKSVQINARLGELLSVARLQQAEGLVGRTLTSQDGTVSGTVAAARVVGTDVVAVLTSGREVTLASGMTVSQGPFA